MRGKITPSQPIHLEEVVGFENTIKKQCVWVCLPYFILLCHLYSTRIPRCLQSRTYLDVLRIFP